MAISIQEIDKDFVQSDLLNLPDTFVAVAIHVNEEGIGSHSGLIIAHEKTFRLIHYYKTVHNEDVPKGMWWFHTTLKSLKKEETETFLAYCELAAEKANPQYGYFIDGSHYDEMGNYISKTQLDEVMTCVGFCLNLIAGYIDSKQYLVITDWKEDSLPTKYLENFIKKIETNSKYEDYRPHLRRIKPSELSASAYMDTLPIKKVDIDQITLSIEQLMATKRPTTT